MKEGGFQVVTDIYGQYRFDYDRNQQCKSLNNFRGVRSPPNQKEIKEIAINGKKS